MGYALWGCSVSLEYVIQPCAPGHIPFILSSWVKTAQSAFSRGGQPAWICRAAHALAWEIIQGQGSACVVATAPDDGDHVYGYAVVRRGVVEMVYTKAAFRRTGVATATLARLGVDRRVIVPVSWTTRAILTARWPLDVMDGRDEQRR